MRYAIANYIRILLSKRHSPKARQKPNDLVNTKMLSSSFPSLSFANLWENHQEYLKVSWAGHPIPNLNPPKII